ncbi:MAG: HAD-IIA family hydrolase [Gordonia amarae]
MSDRRPHRRDDRGGNSRGRNSRNGTKRSAAATERSDDPALPDDVSAGDLEASVRRDLLSLDKANAESVARHLVMVTRLLEEDPALALEHARAARRRGGRIGLVRETAGIAAYNAGEWQEAVSELRTAKRITGSSALLPLIADSERGLGRADRAIEIARSAEGRALTGEEATEMRIVEAGARIDLGEPEKALVTLQLENLAVGQTGTGPARLFYAYASALLAAGRRADAITWFMNASSADVDDVTDAELRLVELTDPDFDETVAPGSGAEEENPATSEPVATPEPAAASEPTVTSVSAVDAVVAEEEKVREPADDVVADEPVAVAAPEELETATEPQVEPAPEPEAPTVDEIPERDGTEVPKVREPEAGTIMASYEALLLDLDGTVFGGHAPIIGARETLDRAEIPQFFVTNNASRRPTDVADHLNELGFEAGPEQVVTSAQSGAQLLAEHLEPGSRALVVGSEGLAQEVREVGIGVARSADDKPDAVIQGYSAHIGWAELSEAALAIRAGALWVATNIDATLPSERGLLVGNGSLVAAVANATGQTPLVAGKPAAPLMVDAIRRSGVNKPLVVGDRLDTDIEGAHTVGLDSVLVLTGVSTARDLLAAPPEQRPTYVVADLRGLYLSADLVRIAPHDGWQIEIDGDAVSVATTGAPAESLLPALAAAVWASSETIDHGVLTVTGADDTVGALLAQLGLAGVG